MFFGKASRKASGTGHRASGGSGKPLGLPCASPLVTCSRAGAAGAARVSNRLLDHPGSRGALARGLVVLAAGIVIASVFPRCAAGAAGRQALGTGHWAPGQKTQDRIRTPRMAGEAVASRDRLPACFGRSGQWGAGSGQSGTDTNAGGRPAPLGAHVIGRAQGGVGGVTHRATRTAQSARVRMERVRLIVPRAFRAVRTT